MSIEHDNSTTNQQVNPNVHGTVPAGSIEGAGMPGSHLTPDTHEQVPHGNVPPVIEAAAASADTLPTTAGRTALGVSPATGQVTEVRNGGNRQFVGQVPHTGQTAPADAPQTPQTTRERKSRKGPWVAVTAAGAAAVAGLVVFLFHGGGNAEQVANSDQGNQGDTKATSQAAAPTAAETSPTSAAETQEAPAGVNYTIDTVSANADPEKYYAGYATEIGMKYTDAANLDEYFRISDAGKSGELDQATAGDQMKAFLEAQLGGNLTRMANALYENPDLTPKEVADLVAGLAPYAFDIDNNPQLEDDVKHFASKIVAAGKADNSTGSLKAYISSGATLGKETTSFVGVYRIGENGQPDDNFYGPEVADASDSSIYLVGRPGFTDGSDPSHFTLRQITP